MQKYDAEARISITVTLNGQKIEGQANPRMLLSDFLRQELGAGDIHIGCEHGVCGACTIHVEGQAVRSCLMLAIQAQSKSIDTVASLSAANGELDQLQLAFRRKHALQCGYCTPGILMTLTQLRREEPNATRARIRDALCGHICRCTGYQNILAAAYEVFELTATRGEEREHKHV